LSPSDHLVHLNIMINHRYHTTGSLHITAPLPHAATLLPLTYAVRLHLPHNIGARAICLRYVARGISPRQPASCLYRGSHHYLPLLPPHDSCRYCLPGFRSLYDVHGTLAFGLPVAGIHAACACPVRTLNRFAAVPAHHGSAACALYCRRMRVKRASLRIKSIAQ